MNAPALSVAPSTDGLLSSLTGGVGVQGVGDSTPSVSTFFGAALDNALNVTAPPQGIPPGKPVDTRTKTQRAADDLAGLVYDPATGTTKPGKVSSALPGTVAGSSTGLGGWVSNYLTATYRSFSFFLVLLILGAGFVYFGVKTLAD